MTKLDRCGELAQSCLICDVIWALGGGHTLRSSLYDVTEAWWLCDVLLGQRHKNAPNFTIKDQTCLELVSRGSQYHNLSQAYVCHAVLYVCVDRGSVPLDCR